MLDINDFDFDFENGVKYSLYSFKVYAGDLIYEAVDKVVVDGKVDEEGNLILDCLDTNYNATAAFFCKGTWTRWEQIEQEETWLCEEAD